MTRPYLDVSLVNVSIDPSTLSGGTYYGRIQVSAVAANSPQVLTVILTVLPAETNLGPQMFPAGLIFTGTAGATPGSQDVQVANLSGRVNNFQSGKIGTGFNYLPVTASLPANQPSTVRVFPDYTNLTPGSLNRGTLTLQFSDGSPSQTVNVLLVVAPSATSASGETAHGRGTKPDAQTQASGCTPLQIVFRSPQPSLGTIPATAGQSLTMDVQVSDICGNLVMPVGGGDAAVKAAFSNNDSVQMTHIGNGVGRVPGGR